MNDSGQTSPPCFGSAGRAEDLSRQDGRSTLLELAGDSFVGAAFRVAHRPRPRVGETHVSLRDASAIYH